MWGKKAEAPKGEAKPVGTPVVDWRSLVAELEQIASTSRDAALLHRIYDATFALSQVAYNRRNYLRAWTGEAP